MQTKPRKGRPTNTERDQILATYHKSRAKGLSQKDSGKLAGINEKTAGKYERAIQEAKNKKIERLQELRERLEKKADSPAITPKELIYLTQYIKQLDDEINKIK